MLTPIDAWLNLALGTEKGTKEISTHKEFRLTTDAKRVHASREARTGGPAPEVSQFIAPALDGILDPASYEEIEADLWSDSGRRTPEGRAILGHMFEDIFIDQKFYDEAMLGIGLNHTCKKWKDGHGPVWFESACGKRLAIIMVFKV